MLNLCQLKVLSSQDQMASQEDQSSHQDIAFSPGQVRHSFGTQCTQLLSPSSIHINVVIVAGQGTMTPQLTPPGKITRKKIHLFNELLYSY